MGNADHYVGLMSGTSLDGVDAVLLKFSGGTHRIVGEYFAPFENSLRTRLLSLHLPQPDEIHEAAVLGNDLARIYARAVCQLLDKTRTPFSLATARCSRS
jgi:anhydro-N-acetylmuramic acid kinase